MMDDMKLPEGYTCGDCANWRKCTALIESIEPSSTECDFSPSRFAVSMNQLAKARAAKDAIRAEYMDLLAMYEKDTDTLRAERDAARAEVARLRDGNRWIPVPERYPDTDAIFPWSTENVQILCGDEVISPCYYNLDDSALFKRGAWVHRAEIIGGEITHWRPLPALPESD